MRNFRIFINRALLNRGFTLINKHGFTVYLDKCGKQIRSNLKRKTPYSMDDPSWTIKWN